MEQFDLEWEQMAVIHCPDRKCKGMLLQSKYIYEHKCSDCNKYWDKMTSWVETTKPKEELSDDTINTTGGKK